MEVFAVTEGASVIINKDCKVVSESSRKYGIWLDENNIEGLVEVIREVNTRIDIKSKIAEDPYSDDDNIETIICVEDCYLNEKISLLATHHCIDNNGRPEYSNIIYINSNDGMKIGLGEVDSFGWISGIIDTGKRIIIFG